VRPASLIRLPCVARRHHPGPEQHRRHAVRGTRGGDCPEQPGDGAGGAGGGRRGPHPQTAEYSGGLACTDGVIPHHLCHPKYVFRSSMQESKQHVEHGPDVLLTKHPPPTLRSIEASIAATGPLCPLPFAAGWSPCRPAVPPPGPPHCPRPRGGAGRPRSLAPRRAPQPQHSPPLRSPRGRQQRAGWGGGPLAGHPGDAPPAAPRGRDGAPAPGARPGRKESSGRETAGPN
jgi:hypothetical protein